MQPVFCTPRAGMLTGLEAHEGGQVHGLGAVIAGEGLYLALSAAAALPGAEAQGTTPGVCSPQYTTVHELQEQEHAKQRTRMKAAQAGAAIAAAGSSARRELPTTVVAQHKMLRQVRSLGARQPSKPRSATLITLWAPIPPKPTQGTHARTSCATSWDTNPRERTGSRADRSLRRGGAGPTPYCTTEVHMRLIHAPRVPPSQSWASRLHVSLE